MGLATRLVDDAREWRRGRSRVPRAVLAAWLAWLWIKLVSDPQAPTLFSGIDLGIHEAGHLLFSGCGMFLAVAGGTILQLLAPVAAGVVLARQGDRFGVCVAAAWLGVNLVEVSVYMGDARAMELPLVTVGGGHPLHDWNYLLGRCGLLRSDRALAGVVRTAGAALHALALLGGGWLIAGMGRARASNPASAFDARAAAKSSGFGFREERAKRAPGFESLRDRPRFGASADARPPRKIEAGGERDPSLSSTAPVGRPSDGDAGPGAF
ncbi:MAG TPA: hypothetical protein VEI02_11705 [Planctomycetota bacterium]|nr:hypothetical protein [Planctomycetota bacterium]